jgi:hypothetical protein
MGGDREGLGRQGRLTVHILILVVIGLFVLALFVLFARLLTQERSRRRWRTSIHLGLAAGLHRQRGSGCGASRHPAIERGRCIHTYFRRAGLGGVVSIAATQARAQSLYITPPGRHGPAVKLWSLLGATAHARRRRWLFTPRGVIVLIRACPSPRAAALFWIQGCCARNARQGAATTALR